MAYDCVQIAERLGIPFAILVFIGFMLWWVARRLFGEGGLGSVLVREHVKFLSKIELLTESILRHETEQLELLHKTANATQQLCEIHASPDTAFATVRLHRAGLKLTRLCEMLLRKAGLNGDAATILEEIRKELDAR